MIIYILVPLLSALIGWLTNYVAIRMLFRPYKPIKMGFFVLHGLIPKRHEALARQIAKTVEMHLVNADDIIGNLTEAKNLEKIRSFLDEKIETFINTRLFTFNPMIAAFINDEIKQEIKRILVEELVELFPLIIKQWGDVLDQSLDIEKMVFEKISGFDLHQLESIILSIAGKELKAIEVWGAVIGFLIGLIQLLLFWIRF